jgi:hypothetical protein
MYGFVMPPLTRKVSNLHNISPDIISIMELMFRLCITFHWRLHHVYLAEVLEDLVIVGPF